MHYTLDIHLGRPKSVRVRNWVIAIGEILARPTAALSDVFSMHDRIHLEETERFEAPGAPIKPGHRWGGATVSNRNVFNAN